MAADRVELESKIAELERTVDALSGELAAHRRTIESLQQNVEALVEQLRRQRAGEPLEPHDTPPPHYRG